MRGKLRFEGEPLSPNILTENTRKTKQKQKIKAKFKPSYMDSVEYSPENSTTARPDGNSNVTANPSELSGDSGHSPLDAEQLSGIPIKKSKLRFDKTESDIDAGSLCFAAAYVGRRRGSGSNCIGEKRLARRNGQRQRHIRRKDSFCRPALSS